MITGKEQVLSAFVDEETSELEVRRLCKQLLDNERELARWSRYHLIRDTLRGNLLATVDPSFAARVMTRIGQEPVYVEATRREWRLGSLRPVMGFGLAASIAVVSVLSFQSLKVPSATAPDVPQLAAVPTPGQQVGVQTAGVVDASRVDRSIDRNSDVAARLNSYLVNHSEYASSQGMVPYARVVAGYESN